MDLAGPEGECHARMKELADEPFLLRAALLMPAVGMRLNTEEPSLWGIPPLDASHPQQLKVRRLGVRAGSRATSDPRLAPSPPRTRDLPAWKCRAARHGATGCGCRFDAETAPKHPDECRNEHAVT
jgi:hypothetical protein